MLGSIIGLLIGIGIGFLLATLVTTAARIKIQDMKWKLDIHELLVDIKKK